MAAAVDSRQAGWGALVQLEQVLPSPPEATSCACPVPHQHLNEASRTLSASTQDLGPR